MMSHKDWAFAAPTGKAAKVLSARVERNGYSASTLHSLLKGSPEGGFMVNRNSPLGCQILVVDEGTMPTLSLFEAATAALRPDAHLIILGDPGVDGLAGQLPSIGAGRVLSDIIRLPGVDHHHLTATKRNSGAILETVNQIRQYSLGCEDRAPGSPSPTACRRRLATSRPWPPSTSSVRRPMASKTWCCSCRAAAAPPTSPPGALTTPTPACATC